MLRVSRGPAAPRRLFYGWVLVGALGVTEAVSYGILSYALPVFIAPMERDLGWSRTEVTGALSLAGLVAGAAAVPVGRWVDRHGARALMTAGSLLGAGVLLLWSRVSSLPALYALAVGLGLAMAAVLYEPALAVVAVWFRAQRGRALTLLTFVGGFASVVFVPLAAWLVAAHGWRGAMAWLAVLLAVLTVPPHALLLRRRPEDLGLRPDGAAADVPGIAGEEAPAVPAGQVVRSGAFAGMALAFGLSALAGTAALVHLVPLLLERGHDARFAGAAVGVLGLMALPGRLVFTPLGDRWPREGVAAALFALQAAGVAALLATRSAWGTWVFVALFGAAFGAVTPARAGLLAERFGRASYARVSGALALVVAMARAAAPVGASLLYAAGGGYGGVLWVLLLLSLAAALAVCAAPGRVRAAAPRLEAAT